MISLCDSIKMHPKLEHLSLTYNRLGPYIYIYIHIIYIYIYIYIYIHTVKAEMFGNRFGFGFSGDVFAPNM